MIEYGHDFNNIREKIIENTIGYLNQYDGIQSLILGVSGGADSALVALLAQDVCKQMKLINDRDIKLIGRSLPIESNKKGEIARASNIGQLTCDDFRTMDLTSAYNHLVNNLELPTHNFLEAEQDDKISLGNIKARIRMIQLYHLAHYHKGIVLSTDNYTEYLLGFWTIHGDVGDFGMIQNLWKTEVYGVLESYKNYSSDFEKDIIDSIIKAVPTDGLGITDSDLDQFGDVKSYKELDLILEEYTREGATAFIKRGGQIPKCLTILENTHYKRNNPFNIPRVELLKENQPIGTGYMRGENENCI